MSAFRNPFALALAVLLLVVTAAGFLLIPDGRQVPTHWGLDGHVDFTLPRNLALIQMPLAAVAIWALVALITRYGNSGRSAAAAAGLRLVLPGVTLLFVLLQVLIVLVGAGVAVPYFHAH